MESGAHGSKSPPAVVGRAAELERVDVFVAGLAQGPAALLIRGEPGIGKSALWQAALERCRQSVPTVVSARPAEEEMPLGPVSLLDLFGERLKEAALAEATSEPLVRGRLVLEAMRTLAAHGPLVLAIDDLQWLDERSAHSLRFALRRLPALPIGVLATARAEADAGDPLRLASTFAGDRVETLTLGPLGLDDLREVIGAAVSSISRPQLRRIHAVSGGNPLYALELARVLDASSDGGPADPIDLPDSLQAAIARRLESVPPELVRLMETIAALGETGVEALGRVIDGEEVESLLSAAESHGLIVIGQNLGVRFSHPLIGTAIYGRMGVLARRTLHRRLAELTADPDARARHLAMSTAEPDSQTAELLEAAAARARARGALDLAADFAGHSHRLTPADDQRAAHRRALTEVVHRAAAGQSSRALQLVENLVAQMPPGPARAEVLVQRFYVGSDELERSDALLAQAVEEAGDDDRLRASALDILGWLRGAYRGDLASGIECARQAVTLTEGSGDDELELIALGHLGHLSALAGEPQPGLMERALNLAGRAGQPRLGGGPRAWQAKQVFWSGRLAEARQLFAEALADQAVSELERPHRLYDLALVECAAGNLSLAEELVEHGLQAARDAEDADAEWWLAYPQALVAAWLGQAGAARATAYGLIDSGRRGGSLPGCARARSVLGLLAISEGDTAQAALELSEGADLLERWGFGHPGALPLLPDAVEALARSPERGRAEELLLRLEGQAQRVDRSRVWAAVERSRGVLLLAGGEPEAALAHLERARTLFDDLGYRPDAARSLLEHGRALARCGRRSAAAEMLTAARDRFGALGAALWQARASEELERVLPGGSAGVLTPTERQVASLVAQGMKNREIGARLYISVATVEAHLTRMYRKLDIRSRSDLVRLVEQGLVEHSVAAQN